MNNQLIISLDKEVIEKAKRYAESNQRSLTHLIESYLKSLSEDSKNHKIENIEISDFVKKMQSGIELPIDLNDFKKQSNS